MKNKYLTSCSDGLIQLVTSHYANKGYFFYFKGELRPNADIERIDRTIIDEYNLDLDKFQRARRKRKGVASVKYLRFELIYVILATHGEHTFFEAHRDNVRDLRQSPLRIFGYSITKKSGKIYTIIERDRMREYRAYFSEIALRRSSSALEREINNLPFERYRGIIKQLVSLYQLVSKLRKKAGLKPLSTANLRDRRKLLQPYAENLP